MRVGRKNAIRREVMDRLAERIRDHWASVCAGVRPGASQRAIEEFEAKYGVKVANELAALYRLVDGMEDSDSDDRFLHIRPLAELEPVTLPNLATSYGLLHGRGQEESDDGFLAIPPLGEDKPAPLREAGRYFVFGDFLLKSHEYAVKLSSDPAAADPVVWIIGSNWETVAATFGEFCEKYLSNPEGLYLVCFD